MKVKSNNYVTGEIYKSSFIVKLEGKAVTGS